MLDFRPESYSPRIAEILNLAEGGNRLMPLVPSRCASEKARQILTGLAGPDLFHGQTVRSSEFTEAARSGLFLYFSCLEESHTISQGIDSTTGRYWHGIMHRQEPDFSNSAYWFRRVGKHEIFPALHDAASQMLGDHLTALRKPSWDPFAFIDACEQVHRHSDGSVEQVLREIQRAEWQLLFDFCCRQAV